MRADPHTVTGKDLQYQELKETRGQHVRIHSHDGHCYKPQLWENTSAQLAFPSHNTGMVLPNYLKESGNSHDE